MSIYRLISLQALYLLWAQNRGFEDTESRRWAWWTLNFLVETTR